MVIGILYLLGVSAAGVLVLLIGLMLFKRYKVINHPAVFKARVRAAEPPIPGLKDTWRKCYAAWVTTVLTTRKGLPLSIADVLPLERLDGVRDAEASDRLQGLGATPIIASFTTTTGAKLEIAVSADDRSRSLRPWPSGDASAVDETTSGAS